MTDHRSTLFIIYLAVVLLVPAGTIRAADPAQINQITLGDGDIPGLGLSFNTQQSYILNQYEPYEVTFLYGDQNADHMTITIYFYTGGDGELTFENDRGLIENNVMNNQVYYRIISRENETARYEALYADQPQLGTHVYGTISFLDGTTYAGVSATLANTYTDQQLSTMMAKGEAKARSLLSTHALTQLQGQITGFTKPLKHIKVTLSDGTKTTQTTTDAQGNFIFNGTFSKGHQYTLTVTFAYTIGDTTYFALHYQEHNETVVSVKRTFTVSSESDLTQDFTMEHDLTTVLGGDWAKTFASMYVHFTEALEFYQNILHVTVNYQLPLDVYTFCSEATGTRYWYNIPGRSYITIDAEKSIHESAYRPLNREYHEFSHYIMHTLYQRWPEAGADLPETVPEINHGGFVNPSTSDSFVEGFAIFMASVILKYSEEAGTIPMTADIENMSVFKMADYLTNTQWAGREVRTPAWANNGKFEELAIAGVLWDLYDNGNMYCDKSPGELFGIYQNKLPEIWKDYNETKEIMEYDAREQGQTNYTYPPLKLLTLQDFQGLKFDDDNVSLSLDAIWTILKTFHNDFTSIYRDVLASYTSQKTEIDKIFINQGFFVDPTPGDGVYSPHDMFRDSNKNGRYDSGEFYIDVPENDFVYTSGDVIGQAADCGRPWRQSVQETPGYFIKVDNKVPFYLIRVSFPNQFYLDYAVQAWNKNGYVPIPPVPAGYIALITVVPENTVYRAPLNLSADVLQAHYYESLSQGYVTDHDFQISGTIPPLPSMPADISGAVTGGSKQTPGFEIVVCLGACLLAMALMRQRRKQ
jgi:hypothetical protein